MQKKIKVDYSGINLLTRLWRLSFCYYLLLFFYYY